MGACASAPKAVKDDNDGGALPPEPAKEKENTPVPTTEAAEVEAENIKYGEGHERHQSLAYLLNKIEDIEAEDQKSDPLPVTNETPATSPVKVVYVAPVARATEEDNETLIKVN